MNCWKCGLPMKEYIYEQQHEGWGFPNYKTEYFKKHKCVNPNCSVLESRR